MEHEIHVVDRPALRVVAKRVPTAIETIGTTLEQAFGEIYPAISAAGIEASGPPFVIYHSLPLYGVALDIEICAPVDGPFTPPTPWQMTELPAGTFASCLHIGPYDTVEATYSAMTSWIPIHGLEISGPPREVYMSEPSTPPEETRTIVEFPVARVPVGVG